MTDPRADSTTLDPWHAAVVDRPDGLVVDPAMCTHPRPRVWRPVAGADTVIKACRLCGVTRGEARQRCAGWIASEGRRCRLPAAIGPYCAAHDDEEWA